MGQFATLMHDHWRSTRAAFIFAAGFSISLCLLVYIVIQLVMQAYLGTTLSENESLGTAEGVVTGLHLSQLFWLMFLLVSTGDYGNVVVTMPRYLMRLPVSAWKLVAARMTYGIATTIALALVGTMTYYALFDETMDKELPFLTFIVIWPVAVAINQCLVWWFGPAGTAVTYAAYIAAFLILGRVLHFDGAEIEQYSALGVASAVAASFLAATAAIAQHRKGRFSDPSFFPKFGRSERSIDSLGSETFASKGEALRWYEHRRVWKLFLPVLMLVIVAQLLFQYSVETAVASAESPTQPLRSVLARHAAIIQRAIGIGLILGTATAAGLCAFVGWRPIFKKDRSFLFVRPATTLELTAARWDSCARAVALGLLPVIGIAVVVNFLDLKWYPGFPGSGPESVWRHLTSYRPLYFTLPMIGAGLAATFVCVWAGLWGENVLGILALVGTVVGTVTFTFNVFPALREIDPVTQEAYMTRISQGILWIVFAALSLAQIDFLRRKQLLSVKHLAIVLGLAPIVGVGVVFYSNFNWMDRRGELDLTNLTTLFPFLMLCIIAPILMAPAITHWARHRS